MKISNNFIIQILAKVIILILLLSFTAKAASKASEVSLDEKIGQLLIVGFNGYEINDEIKTYIKNYHIGGVILISRGLVKDRIPNIDNPKQLRKLNNDLLKLDPSLFISVDQEGGMVARLRSKNGFNVGRNLSHYEIGQLSPNDQIKAVQEITNVLKEYKFNLNFAPTVDIDNKNNPIIGKINRAFSEDPNKIYDDAKRYIQVHHDANIITSIKHFPGHGSSLNDSHLGVVDITKTWKKEELLPYQLLLQNDKYNDMVMIAHVFNENIDKNYPASLSKKTIDGILRKQLGYNGVVITDSLEMNAIKDNYGLKETLIKTLNAGTDILLYTNNSLTDYHYNIVQDMHKIIKEAIANKEISESRINEAYDRVMKLKKAYGLVK